MSQSGITLHSGGAGVSQSGITLLSGSAGVRQSGTTLHSGGAGMSQSGSTLIIAVPDEVNLAPLCTQVVLE